MKKFSMLKDLGQTGYNMGIKTQNSSKRLPTSIRNETTSVELKIIVVPGLIRLFSALSLLRLLGSVLHNLIPLLQLVFRISSALLIRVSPLRTTRSSWLVFLSWKCLKPLKAFVHLKHLAMFTCNFFPSVLG